MLLDLKEMTIASFTRPAAAARDLFALNLDRKTSMAFLALGVVLSVISMFAGMPGALSGAETADLPISPMVFAVVLFVATMGGALGIYWAGRLLSGRGSFDQMVLIMAWTQWLQFLMQLVVLVLAIFVAPLAGLVQLVLFFISIWIFLHMVDQAHGFESLLKSLGVSILGNLFGAIAISVPLYFLLLAFGLFST